MIQEQTPLRGHLGTVPGAQRSGQVVERLEAVANLRHVLLVLSLQHVAAGQTLGLLLVHDVGEISLRDRVDDLGDVTRAAAPEPDLHDLRLCRSADLKAAREPGDGILHVLEHRQPGDARSAQGGVEHERTLDELELRLAVLLVDDFAGPAERADVGSHP
jgi:hypothetical protein